MPAGRALPVLAWCRTFNINFVILNSDFSYYSDLKLDERRAGLDIFMKSLVIVTRPPSVLRALYDFVEAEQSLKASRGFWEAVRG